MPRIFGSASTGGGGTPGGSATQVQYNNAGAFGGITGATTDGTTLTLVAPVLGTPASATLTNATGLPPSTGLSTFVAPLKGGLGAALVPVIGDLLYADSTTSFARIAAPAAGQVLKSNGVGVAPSWSASPTLTSLALQGAGGTSLALGGTANGIISFSRSSGGMSYQFVGDNTGSGGPAEFRLGSTANLMWNSGPGVGVGTLDTNFSRIATGVIGVGTGAQGSTAGSLQAASTAFPGSLTPTMTASGVGNWVGTLGLFGNGGALAATVSNTALNFSSAVNLSWNLNTVLSSAAAATLQHGAADAASPVAQTIKFQDVVAGTSNTAGVNATIQAPAGTGTGAGGSLIFQVAAAGSSGSAKNAWATAWQISGSGHFLAGTNNTYDIGTSLTVGAPRNIFAAGTLVAGSQLNLNFQGRFIPQSDGVVLLTNNAVSDFSRLQFGGTTSTFPALKRSTTALQARLADDSAFTAIQGKLTTDTAYTAGDPTTTGYLVVYDSTGTAYRVPALLN